MSRLIRVAIAHDHELLREGLRRILDEVAGIAVVGQTASAAAIVDVACRSEADVVIVDSAMPGADVADVVAGLRSRACGANVLILTAQESVAEAAQALASGAKGYLLASTSVRELVEAVRSVRFGEVAVSPGLAQRILGYVRKPRGPRTGIDLLSPKERAVLRALAAGMSAKECAAHLDVAQSTVSTYRARLLDKLGLRTTADIIRFAMQNEFVSSLGA